MPRAENIGDVAAEEEAAAELERKALQNRKRADKLDRAAEVKETIAQNNRRQAFLKRAISEVIEPLKKDFASRLSSRLNPPMILNPKRVLEESTNKSIKRSLSFARSIYMNRSSETANPHAIVHISGSYYLKMTAAAGSGKILIEAHQLKTRSSNDRDSGPQTIFERVGIDDVGRLEYSKKGDARTDHHILALSLDQLKDYMSRVYHKQTLKNQEQLKWRLPIATGLVVGSALAANAFFDIDDKIKEQIEKWQNPEIETSSYGDTFDQEDTIIKTPDGQFFTTVQSHQAGQDFPEA